MLIFVFFLGLIFLGLPVSFSFVVAGIFYLLNFTTVSPNIIATTTFTGIDNFALLAIPFFIFAGDIMREGGISKRLVSFAFASFFGRLLTLLRIPSMITTAVLGISSSPTVIMLIIISLLFVFGMVMDMSVSIILLVPIIQPIMLQLGLDPVHIAMIIVFALGIGLITPPMALNLFVGSQISKVPMSKMVRPIIPYVVASLLVLLLIVLVPQISTLLPSLLGY